MNEQAVDRILDALEHKARTAGVGALGDEERTALLAWWGRGLISNGGFKLLLESTQSLADLARRFRVLGFEAAAAACDEVLARVFPAGREPLDLRAREALIAGVNWDEFEPQESVIYAMDFDALARAIGTYIEAHPGAFGIVRS